MNQQDIDILINPQTSYEYLFNSWERADKLLKFWSHRMAHEPTIAEQKLVNYQLLLKKCKDEIDRRADFVPDGLLPSAIMSKSSLIIINIWQ